MSVILMLEWTNAKDISRFKKYGEFSRSGRGAAYWQKKKDEGIVKNFSNWADNSGYLIFWVEFENIDDFAKLWADEEYHKLFLDWNPLVDNLRFRLLRTAVTIPED